MRKLFITILLFTSCYSFGQAIPLDSFYVHGATWTIAWPWNDNWRCSHCFADGVDKVIYKITGDTIVSGIKYHVLSLEYGGGYYDVIGVYSSGVGYYKPYLIHSAFARIRTDSNRVYFTQDTSVNWMGNVLTPIGQEYLLYDFNLSTGSILPANGLRKEKFNAASIDSVALSNGYFVKKYNDSIYAALSVPNDFWIFGIGSSYGFIPNSYYWLYNWGPGPYGTTDISLCYEHPSFSYQFEIKPNFPYSKLLGNCFDLSHVGVELANAKPISFYPNPLTGNRLHFDGDAVQNIDDLFVNDVMGRPIMSFTKPFISGNKELDIPLAPGIYFLRYSLNGNTVTAKVIKL